MAHKATLKIENHNIEYLVIECSYTLSQKMDDTLLQPAEKPKYGQIEFTIVAPDDSDMFFHAWMQNNTETRDGTFDMMVVGKGVPSKRTLNFKGAHCIRLYEYFNMHNSDQMHTRLTIAASEISFTKDKAVVFKNYQKTNNDNK